MCKFPWFSKRRYLFEVYWKNVVICCTWLFSFRWNNCSSHNFNAIYLFRNLVKAGWFVLQSVPLLGLEQKSMIPAQWVRTRTSPWSIRNQTSTAGAEWGFICVIAILHHSLITPRRDTLACFPGTFVVTWPMLNRNKNSLNIDDYFPFSVLRMLSWCPSNLLQWQIRCCLLTFGHIRPA